jgi:hypothetical protein
MCTAENQALEATSLEIFAGDPKNLNKLLLILLLVLFEMLNLLISHLTVFQSAEPP